MSYRLNVLKDIASTALAGFKKWVPVRRGLFVALSIGLTLLYLAAGSDHPLAMDFYSAMLFETSNQIKDLFLLYVSYRVLTGSIMRSHKLLNILNGDLGSPVFIAWCCTWIIAVALVISG